MRIRYRRYRRKFAITLVELLVTISIIGVLIGLLLPAVQSAREFARRTHCTNQVRQLALAVLSFESAYKHLPSGGWGIQWAGLPDRGVGPGQPGGWIYQSLPFLEQSALHDLGGREPFQAIFNTKRLETPLQLLHCPTRRSPVTFANNRPWTPHYHSETRMVARNDYAMNGGSIPVRYGPGPTSLEGAEMFSWPDMRENTGLCFQRSKIRIGEITDGCTSTFLLGEKHVPRSAYFSGADFGDNESAYSGDDRDLIRYTGSANRAGFEPLSDWKSRTGDAFDVEGFNFGSAHSSGFMMAMADGSVHSISYQIDYLVYSHLGNRKDGIHVPSDSFD